jgi:hypothetical protein
MPEAHALASEVDHLAGFLLKTRTPDQPNGSNSLRAAKRLISRVTGHRRTSTQAYRHLPLVATFGRNHILLF